MRTAAAQAQVAMIRRDATAAVVTTTTMHCMNFKIAARLVSRSAILRDVQQLLIIASPLSSRSEQVVKADLVLPRICLFLSHDQLVPVTRHDPALLQPVNAVHARPVPQNYSSCQSQRRALAAGALPLHHLPEADGVRRPQPRLQKRAGLHACTAPAPCQHQLRHHARPTGRIQPPGESARANWCHKGAQRRCLLEQKPALGNRIGAGVHPLQRLQPKGSAAAPRTRWPPMVLMIFFHH